MTHFKVTVRSDDKEFSATFESTGSGAADLDKAAREFGYMLITRTWPRCRGGARTKGSILNGANDCRRTARERRIESTV